MTATKPHQRLGQPGIIAAWQELFVMVLACQIYGDLLADQGMKL